MEAAIITAKPRPTKTRPRENLAGLEGWRLPIRTHSQAKMGAMTITKKAGTCWNQPAGNSPMTATSRFVSRSAKRISEEPACS